MAASGVYPMPGTVSVPKVVALPQQKKILEDVLECIIQLKSEFFDNHQPINDDNITLQRLCAKLEHLIQICMRGKTSLLGRKRDYWDYFCDCLGSAKGSNDGIRYVKNLRENKTSLGRGRAFIRFCLVHQRFADALQQCLANEKTSLWFLPASVLRHQKDSTSLISALYDLNSLHFDLAPRGYDLDADWPSFSNRKTMLGGSWNIPISRRSSITSMDTMSQISVSLSEAADVDKLHKDLEFAQSARNEMEEQLGTLQKENEAVNQSVWESQGQMSVLQEQLNESKVTHASLLERHRDLDVNFVKLKLEKEHLEKLLSDERKSLKEQESKRVQQLKLEEEVWKREMKEEGERRRRDVERLEKELEEKTDEEMEQKRELQQYCNNVVHLMTTFKIEPLSQTEHLSNIDNIHTWIKGLQTKMEKLKQEKIVCDNQLAEAVSNHTKMQEEFEKQQGEMLTVKEKADLVPSLEKTLQENRKDCELLECQISLLEEKTNNCKEEMDAMRAQKDSELNQLKEQISEREKCKSHVLRQMNKTIMQTLELDVKECEVDLTDGQSDLQDEMSMHVSKLCDEFRELNQTYDKLKESFSQEENKFITALEDEKKELSSQVDAALEGSHSLKSQLEKMSEQLEHSNSQVEVISSEKKSIESEMSSMMEDIARHESEKDKLRREIGVLKKDCERAEDESQEKLQEKRKLEVKLEEMEEQLEKVVHEKEQLEKSAEGLYSQTEFSQKVLEESLADSQNALEVLKSEKLELEDKYYELEKEKERDEERLKIVVSDCQRLQNDLDVMVEKVQSHQSDDEISRLKQSLEEEKGKYELEVDTLNSEISALQFQLSAQNMQQYADYQMGQSLAGSQKLLCELEDTVKHLEEENEQLRRSSEEEESLSDKVNKYQIQIESQQQSMWHLEMKMKTLETSLTETISSKELLSSDLSELEISSKKELQEKDLELETLRSDNEGLKKQLLKLIKAKDNLWQKTDALVDERKRKASERWQDNSKVTHCGLCKGEFSLFLRKHHCRLCGNIFCWSCSDHWLDTTHSSKKARVCKTCFDQHTKPDESMLASSLIDNDSDGGEEDGDRQSRTSASYIHTVESGRVQIREVSPGLLLRSGSSTPECANNAIFNYNSTINETDEGKLLQKPNATITETSSIREEDQDLVEDSIYNLDDTATENQVSNNTDNESVDDSVYQVVTQANISKTITEYKSPQLPTSAIPANMTSSMVLAAGDIERGEVNNQNEVWIKPGRQFAVPVKIDLTGGGTTLSWEFTSQPKDIVFSILYCEEENATVSGGEQIVAPCKCDAHKQMHRGELVAKKAGIYMLVFDNTYSRMTSKKIHYRLDYRNQPS